MILAFNEEFYHRKQNRPNYIPDPTKKVKRSIDNSLQERTTITTGCNRHRRLPPLMEQYTLQHHRAFRLCSG